jgi:hypothetical protein
MDVRNAKNYLTSIKKLGFAEVEANPRTNRMRAI